MNRRILIVSAVALVAFCITGCSNKPTMEPTAKIIPVKVMHIGFSDHALSQNYVGTVEESSAVSLSFSAMGTVERVLVTEGVRVRKGQLLAVLDNGTVQNAYDVTKATLKQAQDAYDRLKSLHEKGSITDLQFIEVETGLEQAKSMEAIARKTLDDCNLYAPLNGIIAKRSIEEGVSVMPGLSAFKIVSIDEVYVTVPIPENEIGSIKTGQPATITVSALNNREYNGVVDRKGIEANPVSHSYALKIKTTNPNFDLMPGMVCKVSLQHDKDKIIIIPNKCVQLSPDNRPFVWIANGTTATRRFIAIGSLSDYGIIVENGLAEGDRLIVEGTNKVSEGMQIKIVQ